MSTPEPRRFEPLRVRALRYRKWLLLVFATMLAASIGWVQVHALMSNGWGLLGYTTMLVITGGALAVGMLWKRRESGLLDVNTDGVFFAGRRLVARAGVAQAVVFTGRQGVGVRISRRLSPFPCDIEVESEAEAHGILEALSKGSRHSTASFGAILGGTPAHLRAVVPYVVALMAGLGALAGFAFGSSQTLHASHPFALPTLAIALYLGFVARMLSLAVQAQARLTVGADGVLLATHAFRRTTFYPYATIVDVRRDAGDIVIGLASGESLRLGIGGSGGLDGGEAEREVTAALARIAEARAAYASAGASSDVATVLARGDRDVGSWSAALKALLGDARTYRTPAVPPETLWRVLEDPTQPATARAGAAVALRGTLDDEARGRLRVATATCASAELRGAFEAAAEADDETVETALRAFKAEAG